jgi:hypothetical protein
MMCIFARQAMSLMPAIIDDIEIPEIVKTH